jgi:small-conductance mechanosensitive channel
LVFRRRRQSAARAPDGTKPSPRRIRSSTHQAVLVGIVGYLFVRALNSHLLRLAFWLKRIDAPTLIRNIFTIVAFTILFLIAFTFLFPEVNLGALFTTSAIFGVILGLALQDTLGNFFAGISLQADRPFQVGDVIVVAPNAILASWKESAGGQLRSGRSESRSADRQQPTQPARRSKSVRETT